MRTHAYLRTYARGAADPSIPAFTGGNPALVAQLGGATLRPLALCAGVARTYAARDETGALVGYAIFVPPGQLLFAECVLPRRRGDALRLTYVVARTGRSIASSGCMSTLRRSHPRGRSISRTW